MKLHKELRRALKEMTVHIVQEPFPSLGAIGTKTWTISRQYYIEMKPGIAVTKWHRLARMKILAEMRAQVEFMAKEISNHFKNN